MFAVFYGLLHGAMSAINGFDINYQTSKNREEAKRAGRLTYDGARGNTYLVENGRQVVQTFSHMTGHEVIKDFRTGKIYYDLTEVKREKLKQDILRDGRTTYIFKDDEGIMQYHKHRTGIYYLERDIMTDHYLAQIWVNGYAFYMDIYTGMLLRLADGYDKRANNTEYKLQHRGAEIPPEKTIYLFNQRQKKLLNDSRYSYEGDIWVKEIFYMCSLVNLNKQVFVNEKSEFVDGIYSDYEKSLHKSIDYSLLENRPIIVRVEGIRYYLGTGNPV